MDERKPGLFIGPDLKHKRRVHHRHRAFPGPHKTGPGCRSLVQVVHRERRPVRLEFCVVVSEGVAVLGKLPRRSEQHAAVFLVHHLPGVRPLNAHGQQGPANSALIRTIGHNPLRAAAKIKRVLVAAEALNLHLVGEFASRRVEFPFTHKRILRRPYRTCNSAGRQQRQKTALR